MLRPLVLRHIRTRPVHGPHIISVIYPVFISTVAAGNRTPVDGSSFFQFLQLGIAPLHRSLCLRGCSIHTFMNFKFRIEGVTFAVVYSAVITVENLAHAVLTRLQFAINGCPVQITIGRAALGNTNSLLRPLGGADFRNRLPSSVHFLFQPVPVCGGNGSVSIFILRKVNVRTHAGQPVIIHPEVDTPTVKFRLRLQIFR